jgi:hypothetical protein
MEKLYIAYGSNLNLAQMVARCPSSRVYAQGVLNNWELAYRGNKTNSHATIIRKQGAIVPVLVWEIQPEDEEQLDIYEGYPYYYFKKDIMIYINGKKKKAMVYIMNENQLPGKPSDRYIQTILQGYIDNDMDVTIQKKSLDLNYIECK